MRTIGVTQAKAQFSQLLDAAAGGETIMITRRGKPVAVLAPAPESKKRDAARAIAEWRAYRKQYNITLGPNLTIRQLIEEGRKY